MVNIAMQIVNPEIISGKKILLRLDIDVTIRNGQVAEDFRLKAGLPTLKLCLEYAKEVVIMGHIGRPEGKEDPELSVEPIYNWFEGELRRLGLEGVLGEKLNILENLRFDPGEEGCDLGYAKELVALGDFYINEAFAAYRPAASTTVLPTLLPHAAGLRFFREVGELREVRDNPKKPLVVLIGGAKVEDKLPVIEAMAKIADYVLVGGKIASEITKNDAVVQENVLVGELNEAGTDVTPETIEKWKPVILKAEMIVWNGPVGKIEGSGMGIMYQGKEEELGSAEGTHKLAKMILSSNAKAVIGGGDTISFLNAVGLLEEFENKGFVSTGGGAMLKLLAEGTLPTIEALKQTYIL